jgi:hypothetical protein
VNELRGRVGIPLRCSEANSRSPNFLPNHQSYGLPYLRAFLPAPVLWATPAWPTSLSITPYSTASSGLMMWSRSVSRSTFS